MCGIVGYIGDKRNTLEVLVDGLKKLEYRGYDSSGIAVINEFGAKHVRAVGEIENLEEKVANLYNTKFNLGIAHTRWATHGKPNITNAHPHKAGKIFVVHNGIIENYRELKSYLEKKGSKFRSDTDTEVIAHLINENYQKTIDLYQATIDALNKVQGAYALATVAEDDPDTLVAAKFSSPLVLGVADGEYILASDPVAIAKYTNKVVYFDDGEVVLVTKHGYKVSNLRKQAINKNETQIEIDEQKLQKNGYKHFMQKEIFEQAQAIKDALRGRYNSAKKEVYLGGLDHVSFELFSASRIIFTGCGTAYCAGLFGEYLLESEAQIPAKVDYAHEFRYKNPPLAQGDVVFAISQSGETADTLAAIKEAKRKKVLTIGLVNVVGSSLSRLTDAGIYNHIGPEVAVASTKAYTSQLVILILFALYMAKNKKTISSKKLQEILKELDKIPAKVEKTLEELDKQVLKIAKKYKKYSSFYFLGKKFNHATAIEGSIKLKELAYVHAEGAPAGELKHGPLAMIDKNTPTIFIAPKDSVYEKTKNAIEEVKARDGRVIVITTKNNKELENLADDVLYIPETLEIFYPVLTVLPLQLFAYYMALEKGYNVDKPRNLAKSVTVE